MAQRALWWRQRILPRVPVRQWVLTLPVPLRLRLAWDDDLRKSVLAVVLRTIFGHLKRAAKKRASELTLKLDDFPLYVDVTHTRTAERG